MSVIETKLEEKEFDIWVEGYRATGESQTAQYFGKQKGFSLADACRRYAESHPSDASFWNKDFTAYWACRVFDNEADARKSFG